MLETFTPAVCGSRQRQRAASILFAAAAIAASAAVGAALGALGELAGARRAVLAAAVLALLAAAREAGFVRLPLPQARRQVPESWRFRLPLPLWATGYGAGLGAGAFTYQPVSTFWVACAGALALARPLPAAACFSLYGAGRALMIVWPRRRADDPTAAVERLVGRRSALLRVNAAGLVACAVLFGVAPTAGAAVVGSGLDPTVDMGVLAYARQDGSVLVRSGGGDVYPDAAAPAIDGDLLAYVDEAGIQIVRWKTRQLVQTIRANATAVALQWPLVAFRREDPTRRRLILRNLSTGRIRLVATVMPATDLGRPSLKNGRLVWHVASRAGSRVNLLTLSSGARRVLARTDIGLLRNPSVYRTRVAWVDERAGVAAIKVRSVSGGRVRIVARLRSRDLGYWSTAMATNRIYATRWSLKTRTATIYSFGY